MARKEENTLAGWNDIIKKQGEQAKANNPQKKKVGDSTMITGGAEITPKVTVKKFEMPASMNDGDDTLLIEQSGQAVHLSPGTMETILDWYYGRR